MDDFQQNPEYGLIECVFDTISAESAVFWLGLRGLPPQSRVRIERYMIHVLYRSSQYTRVAYNELQVIQLPANR